MAFAVAILNPNADRGRTGALGERLLFAARGRIDLQLLHTTGRGHAIELAQSAANRGCDAVIAVGGDGTVHEVANGLMETPDDRRPPLGVLPAGSGNDFAYAANISSRPEECIDLLEQRRTRPVDVAMVRAVGGPSRWCLNNVGTLLEGQINFLSHSFNWPRGSGLYLRAIVQTLLGRLPNARLELDFDGNALARRATIFSIGNGPRSGGKFHLVPDATIDDGKFDYVVAPPLGRMRVLLEVRKAIRGGRTTHPSIERGQFSRLRMKSDVPVVAHIDGEPWISASQGCHELTVEVIARGLTVLSKGPTGG